ncbi:MAG: hypothetical protein KA275_01065, partial [Chitinophagaceae bacterium]|nr:hypothetical protein [Chitinophagaceae bacterium]
MKNNKVFRYILALLFGVIAGSIVNMGIIMLGINVVEMPNGFEMKNPETLNSLFQYFNWQQFSIPLLAHAGGTFVGAYLAAKIAMEKKLIFALLIGLLFLIGGIMEVNSRPTPTWYY